MTENVARFFARYDAEPALRARFLAEARTMAGLRHPGVAEILRKFIP